MKKLYVLILSAFLASICIPKVYAQAPGGIATDLSVWYKGDNGVTTNASKLVIQWASSSSNSVTLTPNGVAILPYNDQTTYSSTFNFNPTVTFDGSNNFLRNTTTAYLNTAGSVHYIVVAKGVNRSTAPARALFAIAGNDDGFFHSGAGGTTAFPTIGNLYDVAAAAITSVEDFGIYSAILPKTAAQGTQRGFYNGLKKNYPSPYPINPAFYTLPTTGAYIGADGTTGDNFLGDIAEVILYHNTGGADLADANLEKIHSYLAVKYGITLTSTQNYLTSANQVVWNAATNIGYTNNIFGLGRDNASGLHQKQSKSTNTSQKLVIGNASTLFGTNVLNTNNLTDGQFLIVGDNGLNQALNTPLVYTAGSNGTTNFRFDAIWKVQNTGVVGNVTLAWPKGLSNLYLVQSSNAVIDNSDTFTPMTTEVTVNGVVYNTATVNLINGQFFTLAGYQYAPGGVVSAAWYRADAGATLFSDAGATLASNAATIQQWNEFNNKPYPLSQSTATFRPQFSSVSQLVNFNPSINYDGTQKWLQYDPADAQGYIINRSKGALFSAGSTTTTGAMFGFGASGAGNAMDDPGLYSYTGNKFLFYPVVGEFDPQSTYAINNTYIGGGTWENGAGVGGNNATSITLDGLHQTYNTNIANVNTATDRNALMVGKADAGAQLNGQQNEMIVFPNKLTDQEVNRVESYLAIKYGQTLAKEQNRSYLSATGTVVWDGSDISYYNNILGIAREDISALHQKQSKSVNSGQKLIIGNGSSLFNTNIANTNPLTDGRFLMVGDNGLRQNLALPLSYTAGSNGATNFRFESIWKVQNTGSVGTVTLAWPKGVNNLYLVQSADATFDGTDTFTPMAAETTVNGVVYNTTSVTLTNGQFFTFAGFGNAPGGVSTNLSFWYRADKNATNAGAGTDVTAWTDMWNGTTSTQLGTNALPKYVTGTSAYFNFNPGINFTANTQSLGNIAVQTLTSLNYDVFTFTKEGMTDARFFNIGRNNTALDGANWDSPAFESGGNIVRRNNAGGGPVYFANPGNSYVAPIPSIAYTAFTDVNLKRGVNGSPLLGPASNHSAIGTVTGGHIFGRNSGTVTLGDDLGFTGHIGETIVYGAGTLSSTERRRVDSYLAIKYGITLGQVATDHYLDTDGNIVWNGAANATYNNNIFGVSRDDIEILEQKVSKSVNAGTILTVATSNDFVNPNQAAARTGFANDKTYFLLGDNNVAVTPLVNLAIAGNTFERIQKAWRSQRKNTPSALYFEANLSTYGVKFAATRAVSMIVADDAAFTTNVNQIAGTYIGGKWVFANNFDANNVQRYITFASLPCTNPGVFDAAGLPSTTGVSNLAGFTGGATGWPANVPNGHIVIESKNKGFVITRVANTAAITTPIEGMLIYDISANCVKLYNGTTWNCLANDCL